MTSPARTLVEGVDVDAVAAAVRACPAVEDLYPGAPGEVATYLPGRRVLGIHIDEHAVLIEVRGRWGVSAGELAKQVRRATAKLVDRRVDIVIGDIGDPPQGEHASRDTAQGDRPQDGGTRS